MTDGGVGRSKHQPADWQGEAAITPGLGVFRGLSGNNKSHRHWAHQVTIALNGSVTFETDSGKYCSSGVLIPAGTLHRQLRCESMSLYIDPTSSLIKQLALPVPDASVLVELQRDTVESLMLRFPLHEPVKQNLSALLSTQQSDDGGNSKLNVVLRQLQQATHNNLELSRDQLAECAFLSPSRFSHWFREETGMPLRSYRKWLRVIHALEMAVVTRNLSEAAQMAGFADQSHFTRAVSQAFGIRPKDLLGMFSIGQR